MTIARERSRLPADTYGRIKRQLRAVALKRIHDANYSGDDPSLESWMTSDSADASAEALDSPEIFVWTVGGRSRIFMPHRDLAPRTQFWFRGFTVFRSQPMGCRD